MARRGLKTRRTLRILTTEIAPELKVDKKKIVKFKITEVVLKRPCRTTVSLKVFFFFLNCLLAKAYEITTMYKSNTTKSIKTFFATLFLRRLLMYPQLYCFFLPFFKQSLSQIFTNQLFTASSYSTPSSSLSQKQTRLMQKEKKLIFFLISKLFYVWPTFTWRRKKIASHFFLL